MFSIPNEPGVTDENVLGLRGKKTNPQRLLSLLLLLLMLCFSLCYVKRGVTAFKIRLQEETGRNRGNVKFALRETNNKNRYRLFTEATVKMRATE